MKNLSLTYCTNVHPLGDWGVWSDLIGRFGPMVRDELGWPGMPMGLWFPASFIEEMNRDPRAARERLLDHLSAHGLSAFTCNAFPYGNFHDAEVKTKVYQPDWTTPERLAYTVACARLLAAILPAGAEGSVSTLPLGWRVGWTAEHGHRAAANLCAFAREARALAEMDGRTIRLGLEPEPGCALETTLQVRLFWAQVLRPEAKRAGLSDEDLSRFLGVCYDTCHQAVQFEDPVDVLEAFAADGIPIAKMQLSSALEFKPDPARATLEMRRRFVEPRFLHQVRVRTPVGVAVFDDLPQALAEGARPIEALVGSSVGTAGASASSAAGGAADKVRAAGVPPAHFSGLDLWDYPWRVHFHLPIDSDRMLDAEAIGTTREDMLAAFQHAVARKLCRHFEVETYTWSVLPEAHRPDGDAALAASLARELRFIEERVPPGYVMNGWTKGRHG
ncbi:MAG: metabolite traffic protein EboE [Fibrobacteres bacterium]|nr:metabolite traffic protein EboE [Fibrobacterota bacterium]